MTVPPVHIETTPDLAPPHAAALAESLRAFGYDLATALADLADNSLYHQCRTIDVHFHWAGERSAIAISDDGSGMDEQQLVNSMRVGSQSPLLPRDAGDLGRFGLGLKTASFSQCRRMTVLTKQSDGEVHVRCWDLDHIAKTNTWQLLREATPLAEQLALPLSHSEHGTVVVWEKMDRLTGGTNVDDDFDEDTFLRGAERVGNHFAVVFHRRMAGENKVRFLLNGSPIMPWDPFMADEPATQRLPPEQLNYNGHMIAVQAYVLPHLSKLSVEQHRAASGVRGWNAQQGFYIYRNGRLLVPGNWLGIRNWRQEEHYKLARIRVDVPNALDHEWEIDVTKSVARPPVRLRRELGRIGEFTRNVAKRVYSHRGAKLLPADGQDRVFLWEQRAKNSLVSYRINRDHPLVRQVRSTCSDSTRFLSLLRLIEETVPVPLILSTDREMPDRTAGPFEEASEHEVADVMRQVFESLRLTGLSADDALLRLATIEPFGRFPQLLQIFTDEGA